MGARVNGSAVGAASPSVAARVDTSQPLTNQLAFGDHLATAGPSVDVVVGPSGRLLVQMSAIATKTTTGNTAHIAVALSGANTLAASEANGVQGPSAIAAGSIPLSRVLLLTGLNPGPTTVKLQYKTDGNVTFAFFNRCLAALPL